MSFDQQRLDSSITVGEEELQKARLKIQEQEAIIAIYEKDAVEHKNLQTNMQNSYRSFIRDVETLKRDLALAELRNQELKEENIKMNVQLSGKIDLLMNERQEYTNIYEQEFWCEIPRYQFVQMAYYSQHYQKCRVRVDLENHITNCVQPYEPNATDV